MESKKKISLGSFWRKDLTLEKIFNPMYYLSVFQTSLQWILTGFRTGIRIAIKEQSLSLKCILKGIKRYWGKECGYLNSDLVGCLKNWAKMENGNHKLLVQNSWMEGFFKSIFTFWSLNLVLVNRISSHKDWWIYFLTLFFIFQSDSDIVWKRIRNIDQI